MSCYKQRSPMGEASLLGFTEVFEDEGDFSWGEELGLGRHGALAEGLTEFMVTTDPGVEVAKGSRGGGSGGEV